MTCVLNHIHRIIPARAGFTPLAPHCVVQYRDHPRSRGVYAPTPSSNPDGLGSSPLARGLLLRLRRRAVRRGIIPARAGFTPPEAAGWRRRTDHPRSRGVYSVFMRALVVRRGSSPLARGLPQIGSRCTNNGWIIPARAGFTEEPILCGTNYQDHPRSRGVYHHIKLSLQFQRGSSPLARGLRLGAPHRGRRARIIPARAGFTRRPVPPGAGQWDHPRSRGVYVRGVIWGRYCMGSSPLARGLLAPAVQGFWTGGIIPARAGFTTP